jgi:diguanylate cyclase (GGDEF)-like protein
VYYLDFANQVQLMIIVVFSGYLLFTSIGWSDEDVFPRTFGTLFSAPLVLMILSFLSSPVNRNTAYFFNYCGMFLMIFLLFVVHFSSNDTLSLRFIELAAWLSPIPVLVLSRFVTLVSFQNYANMILLVPTALLILSFVYVVIKNKPYDAKRTVGVLFIPIGLQIPLWTSVSSLRWLSLAFLLVGFALCSLYLFGSTNGKLKKINLQYSRTIDRINQSVQNEVTKRVEAIEKSNKKLVEISKTDGLTGAYMKTAILNFIDRLIERAPNAPFSLIMLDIDFFKTINDTQGHQTGDRCLKTLASIARTSFRSEDIIGRYGGDEFTIILPGANPTKAIMVAERFRQNIEKGTNPRYTVSIGISTYPQDAVTTKDMLEAADRGLYLSKKKGRNAVSHVSQLTNEQQAP